jgi:hypothetical protein
MGSSGGKPRKPNQHHLPKVGSPANVEYEFEQRRREAFKGWPAWLVGAILVLALAGWLIISI